MADAMTPQLIMILEIQILAPILCRIRLLGISNRKYPMKKMPLPKPNAAWLICSSAFICRAANPTLTRSRYATIYNTNMKGIRRSVIRRTARASTTS